MPSPQGDHLFKHAVVGKVTTDTTVGMENHEVVVDAIVSCKEVVAHHAAGPASNNVGIGVANVVDVLSASAYHFPEFAAAPVDAWRGVVFLEIVIFWIPDGGVVVIGAFANETFHVVAAVIAIAEVFGTEDGGGELA